ncbi:MAG: TPR end-of-group domain-containing protein [Armatimonadota bacterium]
MAQHDAYNAEMHLNSLMHRGQWAQALALVEEWLAREPLRAELLLRKAQILRALQRFEQGLAALREYRAQRAAAVDLAFQEVDFLLGLGRTTEALETLEGLPPEQKRSAHGEYCRGRVLLARKNVRAGLQALWSAYARQPGFNRALVEWAATAQRYYGKRHVRRQLQALLARHGGDPTVAISVGLALNLVDSRYGGDILRYAVERYPEFASTGTHHAIGAPRSPETLSNSGVTDDYRIASEHILTGRYPEALDAYYQVVEKDPVWMPLLAPMVAEVLIDELMRPEDARMLLEEALRQVPTDYRLHMSYTRVFLRLGFAEEAISSAKCAMELVPEPEKPVAMVQRAGAYMLAKQRELAIADLVAAVSTSPEARSLIRAEATLRPLARDPRFRILMADHAQPPAEGFWRRVWHRISGT